MENKGFWFKVTPARFVNNTEKPDTDSLPGINSDVGSANNVVRDPQHFNGTMDNTEPSKFR